MTTQPLRTRRDYGETKKAAMDLPDLLPGDLVRIDFDDPGFKRPAPRYYSREFEYRGIQGPDLILTDTATGQNIFVDPNDGKTLRVVKLASGGKAMLSITAFAEELKESKFEKGKPADPTKNMSPEDAKKWDKQTDEHKDEFKSAADDDKDESVSIMYHVRGEGGWKNKDFKNQAAFEKWVDKMDEKWGDSAYEVRTEVKRASAPDYFKAAGECDYETELKAASGDEKESKFEKGKPADPTKNMSDADAKEWKEQKEKHEDEFKSAAGYPGDKFDAESVWQVRQDKGEIVIWQVQKGSHSQTVKQPKLLGEYTSGGAAQIEAQKAQQKLKSVAKKGSFEEKAAAEGDEKESKYEKGKPADPTENMSPEDAKKWDAQTDEHKDEFKTAALMPQATEPLSVEQASHLVREVTQKLADQLSSIGPLTKSLGLSDVERNLVKFRERPGLAGTYKAFSNLNGRGYWTSMGLNQELTGCYVQVQLGARNSRTVKEWYYPAKSNLWPQVQHDVTTFMTSSAARMASDESADKTAASGLYGYTKEAERVCGAATNRLQKYATKLAKEIYEKDGETPAFLEEHSRRTGSRSARMLRACMAGIGPGHPEKTAGRKDGGRYGFGSKTSRLGLQACADVDHEAGSIASDLHSRLGTKHAAITGFLGKHSKRAKCGWSEMILDAYPAAPAPITASFNPTVEDILAWDGKSPRTASSFLVADEDEEDAEEVAVGTPKCAAESIKWLPAKNEDEAEWQETMDAKAKKGKLTDADRKKIESRGGKFGGS